MKTRVKILTTVVPSVGLALVANLGTMPVASANSNNYVCAQLQGQWLTWSSNPKGTMTPLIRWQDETIQGWSPRQRCITVSNRFKGLSDNGNLNALVGGVVNRSPVICGVRALGNKCNDYNVLVTLPQGTNPDTAIRQLLDITSRVNGRVLQLSGHTQAALESNYNGRVYYNFQVLKDVVNEVEQDNQVPLSELTPVQ